MRTIFIVAVFTLALNLGAVHSALSANTDAGSSEEKFMESEDQFVNNDNQWEVFTTTMATAKIEDGNYIIENKTESGELFILHHADFPLGKEFIIETSIKTTKSSDNNTYGLVIGASDASNSYVFQIMQSKKYSAMKFQHGDAQEIAGGTIRKRVFKEDSFNVLKIEKIDTTMRFYINNFFVDEVSEIALFGKKIGFFIEGKSEIAIDYTRSQIWFD